MYKVYKIPAQVDIDVFKTFVGEQGTKMNPIEDVDGNWIISEVIWNMEEFQYLKKLHSDIVPLFELIDYKPKPFKANG